MQEKKKWIHHLEEESGNDELLSNAEAQRDVHTLHHLHPAVYGGGKRRGDQSVNQHEGDIASPLEGERR